MAAETRANRSTTVFCYAKDCDYCHHYFSPQKPPFPYRAVAIAVDVQMVSQ